MKLRVSKTCRCPYYKGETQSAIYCEGYAKGHTIHQAFDTTTRAKLYKEDYCKRHYEECPVEMMLEENR